jgi:hypothetical protein
MSRNDSAGIFIVGAPRSGTSLLRVMLNRHPAIALCDETFYFFYAYQRRRVFGDLSRLHSRELLVRNYLATNRIRRLGLDAPELTRRLLNEGTSHDRMFAALLQFYARSHGKPRWGEKTPQHALVAATLTRWYPSAIILHIVRDPRDVVASLIRMPWGSRSVLLNARLWQNCTAAAERCRNRPNYLLVRYESLVQDPEPELRRVCAAIGEDYTPQLLDASTRDQTDRWWFQRAQEPLTRQRTNAWQQQLTGHQIAIIERVAAADMIRFGYQPTGPRLAAAGLARAFGQAACEIASARLRNLPRLWHHWVRPTDLAGEEAWIDRHSRTPSGEPSQAG